MGREYVYKVTFSQDHVSTYKAATELCTDVYMGNIYGGRKPFCQLNQSFYEIEDGPKEKFNACIRMRRINNTLRNHCKSLDVHGIVDILITCAEGFVQMHTPTIRKGYIDLHRDIKIDNFMVDDNDDVVIIDFGMSTRTKSPTEGPVSTTFLKERLKLLPSKFGKKLKKRRDGNLDTLKLYEFTSLAWITTVPGISVGNWYPGVRDNVTKFGPWMDVANFGQMMKIMFAIKEHHYGKLYQQCKNTAERTKVALESQEFKGLWNELLKPLIGWMILDEIADDQKYQNRYRIPSMAQVLDCLKHLKSVRGKRGGVTGHLKDFIQRCDRINVVKRRRRNDKIDHGKWALRLSQKYDYRRRRLLRDRLEKAEASFSS